MNIAGHSTDANYAAFHVRQGIVSLDVINRKLR
jgi:hypothetical protein